MADLYTRSYNPIWDFRSLTGLPLDDTSWAYFLENTIPYLPQAVYHTANGTPWNNPVQLSAAGTLQDIFFDPNLVYRIEIRTNLGNLTPPSQNDPLVWLIENYVPNGGGSTPPITTGTITSSNEITNPQFSLISFSSPYALTNQATQTINVAPGWDLVLTGSAADVTLTQLPLNSTDANPTNASYALEIELTGWTSAYLRQRFNQNGILWADKHVTGSLTARIEGAPQTITSTLVDSQANLLATIINTNIGSNYEEYTGTALLGVSANTDIPPEAYIEYRINLPGDIDISITSLQLLATSNAVALTYEQDTIERQIDHTYHYYKDSILLEPKSSILVGWDFPLNPWQFTSSTPANLSGNGSYTADQTIVITEEADAVQVGASTDPVGYLSITSRVGQAQGRVAIIQYIDPTTAAANWNQILSSMVQALFTPGGVNTLSFKMKLITSTTLPSTVDPIASWGTIDPVFTGQWTAVSCTNDPTYLLSDALQKFSFNGFNLPALTATTATLGIVLYTVNALSSTVVDTFLIKNVSLVKNEFAIETPTLTFDETLRQCEFYYEKSYQSIDLPGTNTNEGQLLFQTFPTVTAFGPQTYRLYRFPFNIVFRTVKRTNPDLTLYAPDGTLNSVRIGWYLGTVEQDGTDDGIGDWTLTSNSEKSSVYLPSNTTEVFGDTILDAGLYAVILLQYVLDARLGLVA